MSDAIVTGRGWGSGAGRQKGTPNKKTAELKELTKQFFARIIDDELEAKFWRYFISGYQEVVDLDGKTQIVPLELNPVAWAAFKRAVEYKRGMPIQVVEESGHVNFVPLGPTFEAEPEKLGRIC